MISRHLTIRGRVQGVGFRFHMRTEAERLGVAGWVRNRRDGTVEAIAQGDESAVEKLIEWAHRGPPSARVISVEVTEQQAGDYSGFEHRATV